MPEIRKNSGAVTQISTLKLPPQNQDEGLELMKESPRFMATQPGFVSVSLPRSEDGNHVVKLHPVEESRRAATRAPLGGVPQKWPRFGQLIEEAEACLYDVTFVESA
jgi:hypothetical protein